MSDPITKHQQAIAEALIAEQEAPTADAPQAPPPADPLPVAYPMILGNNRPLRDITAEIVTLLHQANEPPRLFVQAGRLVRLRQDERGQAWLEPVTDLHLRYRLSQIADVVQASSAHDQVWHVVPPLALMRNVLAMERWPFPPVEGLVETPIVRPDGSLRTTPGYDAPTWLLYHPAPGVTFPPLPPEPTPDDIQQIGRAACR